VRFYLILLLHAIAFGDDGVDLGDRSFDDGVNVAIALICCGYELFIVIGIA
jgi:hypothetical protein